MVLMLKTLLILFTAMVEADKKEFNNILEFKTKVISYKGNTDWIDPLQER